VTTHTFSCPGCGQTIVVNAEMRETMLAVGCPVCTTAVTPDDFSECSGGLVEQ